MTQLCILTKIRTKQWLVLDASAFQCMRAGFLCPKRDNFAYYTYPTRSKWASSEKMIFFAKTLQSNVAMFPCVVQPCTQPYSFGRKIKLIICQIRHKLSLTIQKISTSWKNVRWRTQYKDVHPVVEVVKEYCFIDTHVRCSDICKRCRDEEKEDIAFLLLGACPALCRTIRWFTV